MALLRALEKTLLRDKRTIGVVGIGSAGKTVFLTSLISHLRYHEPDMVCLEPTKSGQVVELVGFKEIRNGLSLPFFDYERIYADFRHDKHWPDKTTDCAYYRCEFQRTDKPRRTFELTLIDFPGERFNDVLMMDPKINFTQWSERILRHLQDNPRRAELAAEYFQLFEQATPPDSKTIIIAYQRLLARLMQDWNAYITPSVFALDTQGQMPQNHADPDKIIEGRVTGIDAENSFAPLPAKFRLFHADMAARFAQRYERYRQQIVKPQFDHLRRCDALLVLVDIPGLLASHVGRFNDTEHIIGDVLDAISHHRETSVMTRLMHDGIRFFSFDNLKKIAFLATKADMVHPQERDKLRQLLKGIAWHQVKRYPRIEREFFTFSAIDSTFLDDEGRLVGYPVWDSEGHKLPVPEANSPMIVLNPSPLPERWPGNWQPGDYIFPEVYPLVPMRQSEPPRQHGMSGVMNFILS